MIQQCTVVVCHEMMWHETVWHDTGQCYKWNNTAHGRLQWHWKCMMCHEITWHDTVWHDIRQYAVRQCDRTQDNMTHETIWQNTGQLCMPVDNVPQDSVTWHVTVWHDMTLERCDMPLYNVLQDNVTWCKTVWNMKEHWKMLNMNYTGHQ